MINENNYLEWIRMAELDVLTANRMNEVVYPRPLEIICFHCQQSAEKMLKALILANGGVVQKTHDLEYILEQLSEYCDYTENIEYAATYLTQYAVVVRYPHEVYIDESSVSRAISYMNDICDFVRSELEKIQKETSAADETETESENPNLTNLE